MVRATTPLLLTVTAVFEGGTGLALLAAPSLTTALLLGVGLRSPESVVVARVAGAALLAIGVCCWLERYRDRDGRSGLIAGLAVYNGVVLVLLAYAAVVDKMNGLAVWPACILHAAMLVWCVRMNVRSSEP